MDNYSSKYDNFILLGDLNSEPTESAVRDFCQIYISKNLVKVNSCLTNRPKCFQNSVTLETGLSDSHKMTLTVMKVFYKKRKPTIITYRISKYFSKEVFMTDVQNGISRLTSMSNELELDIFITALNEANQRHAPIKQ